MQFIEKTTTNGKQVCSAQKLHQWLKVEDHFTQWAKRMFKYGFTEDSDYKTVNEFVVASNGIGGTNKMDYLLTVDCAKEISMLQNTDRGKQIRQYFIQKEKELRSLNTSAFSRKQLAQMVIEQEAEKEQASLTAAVIS